MNEQNSPTLLDGMYRGLLGTAIRRPKQGRWLGGVAAGLAARFNVDPVLMRVILFVLGIFFGLGVALYLLAWVLLPDEDGSIVLDRALRQHQAGAIVLTVLAALTLLAPTGVGERSSWSVSVLAIAAVVGIWYVSRDGRPIGAAGAPLTTADSPGGAVAFAAPGTAPNVTSGSTSGASGVGGPAAADSPAVAGSTWPPAGATPPPVGATPPPAGATTPPPAGPTPPAPPTRPTPPGWHPPASEPVKRGRRSGGLPLAIVAVGLSLITYQGVRLAASAANLSGDHETLAWAGVIGVLGLVVLGAALAGWRLGLVGVGAAILAVLTALGLAGSASIGPGGRNLGSQRWTPTSASDLRGQYSVTFGDGRLDLTGMPVAALNGRTLSARAEFGDLTVIVPEQARVTINPEVRFGNLEWDDADGATRRLSGNSADASPIVVGSGPSALVINATVGFGNLDIERE